MGGLLLGPAIGALGAERFGGISFVFVFGGIAAWVAAIPIGLRGRETGQRTHPAPSPDATEFPSEAPSTSRRAAARHRRRPRRRTIGPGSPDPALEPRARRRPRHQRRRLLRGRDLRGHLEPVPPAPGRRPRPHRADVRDVRAAGAAAVAVRRAAGRPARVAGVHRRRLDPAGGHRRSPTRGSRTRSSPYR